MEGLDKLAAVGAVTKELTLSLGLGDNDLSEFLVARAQEARSAASFVADIQEQDDDFPADLAERVFKIVEKSLGKSSGGGSKAHGAASNNNNNNNIDANKQAFPGLGMKNNQAAAGESETERRLRMLRQQLDKEKVTATVERQLDLQQQQRNNGSSTFSSSNSSSDIDAYSAGHKRRRVEDSEIGGGERRPNVGGVFDGLVKNIKDYGCFVELSSHFKDGIFQGLVHTRNIAVDMKGRRPEEIVKRGQRVKVKVTSIVNGKIALSMAAVDQRTGAELDKGMSSSSSVSTAAFSAPGFGLAKKNGQASKTAEEGWAALGEKGGASDLLASRRKNQTYSEEELWEIRQLINSGVLPVEAYPNFDEETGIMGGHEETTEQLEVERIEDIEPSFLRGQTALSTELSQIKIVKNPEGSMQRAAQEQASLTKERREIKATREQMAADAAPSDLNTPWLDPMAEARDRTLAASQRGSRIDGHDQPEWKKAALGGSASFGIVSNKSMQAQRESLPIFKLKPSLVQAFHDHQVLVVIGETGSGKTTQMTQYLYEMGLGERGIIGCTQPRRVAAVSIAKRVAEESGCQCGQQVGYTIRFDDCSGPETRIKYMTDGMLMREYLMDGDLKRYSVIILDEAHERTIHTDVLFALLKQLLDRRRKDFKLVITSATLDADKFSSYFFDCPIFTIPGRTFPVSICYAREAESDYLDAALITCMQIHMEEPPGDILLFLTGQEEIDTACEILYERTKALGSKVPELLILPAYGSLPAEMQSRIFEPAPRGARKLVIATNIAEASITLDGVFYVVDPGFGKQNIYNPKMGMDSLVVTPISQASARQRAGRAGRTGPGKCFRLYTELAYKTEMLPTSVPELQRTNLASVVLQLKAMGINDLLNFDFMDKPPMQTLVAAMESLYALGALDDEGLLTRIGRKLANFPLDPILAKTLVGSVELGCADEVITVVAMLSVENIFYRPKEKQGLADQKKARFFQPEGDHLTLLAVYQGWKKAHFSKPWCIENFVQSRSIQRAQDIRQQLASIMDRFRMPIESCGRHLKYVQMAIASGFFTHVAKRDPQEGYRTLEGTPVYLHPGSALFQKNPELVIYHTLVMTTKEYMHAVCLVQPQWLLDVAPNFFRKSDPLNLNKRKRMEKIQPLFDKRMPPDAWRLSKRQG